MLEKVDFANCCPPFFFFMSTTGGVGGMSDQDLQDGAPAAATASRTVGGSGKCHSSHPPGKTYQCTAGPYGCPSSLCLDCGQLCRAPDEDTLALTLDPAPHPPAGLPVEKLGRTLRLHTPCSAASRMTRLKPAYVVLLTQGEVTVAAVMGV